jgi:RNA-directed DNA polymerase
MNPLDWFVQRELRCGAYLCYVDDFALFSNSKAQLCEWRAAVIERLARLRLTAHERAAQIVPCAHGVPWLGFVVYPTHRRLKQRKLVQFTRRLALNLDLYQDGVMSFGELDASVRGWVNHVRNADPWGLRAHVFASHPLRVKRPKAKGE